ncbi:MAG TPA: serine hydrolase domain-containing protein [Gaiellaceae bacterium]|nr:serine hydrolase domain-containing protein [Gaiellaceae bacterium]
MSADLDRLVREAQSEHRLPSVSARVVVRGETVLELAVGTADAPAGIDATPELQYRIGSITKTFTAAAVMALVDAGKIGLDEPVGKYVGAAGDRPLPIRRLLAHTSGLQRESPGNVWETFEFPTMEQLLARLDEAEQVLQPGAWWHYSNLAYALLGEVVTQVSGSPAEVFIAERLFRPVGLERTTWERTEPAARGYYVDPFSGVLRPEAEISRIGGLAPVGDLWSTTADLCRWGAWLADREPMHAVQAMADPTSWLAAHGLGLRLHRRGDRILYGHDGAMPGFLASLICSRDEDVQCAVLTNSSTGSGEVVELALGLAEKAIEQHPREPEVWRGQDEPPPEIAELLGSWWTEGEQVVFGWRDGKLEAQLPNASARVKPSVFEREGDDLFRVATGRERGERLEVVREAAGAVVKLYWATYPLTREPEVFGPTKNL